MKCCFSTESNADLSDDIDDIRLLTEAGSCLVIEGGGDLSAC